MPEAAALAKHEATPRSRVGLKLQRAHVVRLEEESSVRLLHAIIPGASASARRSHAVSSRRRARTCLSRSAGRCGGTRNPALSVLCVAVQTRSNRSTWNGVFGPVLYMSSTSPCCQMRPRRNVVTNAATGSAPGDCDERINNGRSCSHRSKAYRESLL